MVVSDELPGDGADPGLEAQAADDTFQRQILWTLADQRRPDLDLARRIDVFAVQRAEAESGSADGREQQGAQVPLVCAPAPDGAEVQTRLVAGEGDRPLEKVSDRSQQH